MTATKRRTSRPQSIDAWQKGPASAAVRGPVRVVHTVIKRLEIPWMWDYRLGCYLVPIQRIDDLLAALEIDGHRVEYRTALW